MKISALALSPHRFLYNLHCIFKEAGRSTHDLSKSILCLCIYHDVECTYVAWSYPPWFGKALVEFLECRAVNKAKFGV